MNDAPAISSEWVELGYISGVSGVRGWVKLYSYTRPRKNLLSYRQFTLRPDQAEIIVISDIKTSGKNLIGKINSIENREQALTLLGKSLWVHTNELKKAPDEYFWHELIGLSVINKHGDRLGIVQELMETGANDVLVITPDQPNKLAILIPYVFDYYVLSVDLEKQVVTVDWDKDWLSDEKA